MNRQASKRRKIHRKCQESNLKNGPNRNHRILTLIRSHLVKIIDRVTIKKIVIDLVHAAEHLKNIKEAARKSQEIIHETTEAATVNTLTKNIFHPKSIGNISSTAVEKRKNS